MSIDITPTRRTVILAGAGALTTVALAACSSSGDSSDTSSTDTAGSSGTDSSGSVKPLAKLSDVTVGSAISVTLPDGKPGIVARPTSSTAAAFSAICTHMGCTVAPSGNKLNCPCHGSVYNALTGAVEIGANGGSPDSQAPLPKVAVKVVDGEVVPT